jgi:hypothetical protein
MGVYVYLYCFRCREYIHVGKHNGPDFEVDYKTFSAFLDRHQYYNGCTLATLTDSGGSGFYCDVMNGKEYPDEVEE